MACEHPVVGRADYVKDQPFWKCDTCNHEFLPAAAVEANFEVIMDTAADLIYRTQQLALRGEQPEQKPPLPEGMFEYTPETCPDHQWNGGQCVNCGTSQFLG